MNRERFTEEAFRILRDWNVSIETQWSHLKDLIECLPVTAIDTEDAILLDTECACILRALFSIPNAPKGLAAFAQHSFHTKKNVDGNGAAQLSLSELLTHRILLQYYLNMCQAKHVYIHSRLSLPNAALDKMRPSVQQTVCHRVIPWYIYSNFLPDIDDTYVCLDTPNLLPPLEIGRTTSPNGREEHPSPDYEFQNIP